MTGLPWQTRRRWEGGDPRQPRAAPQPLGDGDVRIRDERVLEGGNRAGPRIAPRLAVISCSTMHNVEFKCELRDLPLARSILKAKGASFIGELRQTDTYYKISSGRLKKRECEGEPVE